MKKHIILFCGVLVVFNSFTFLIAQNPWNLTDEQMNIYTNSESYIHSQAREDYWKSIPRLAWLSDVVGIGRITNAFNTGNYDWDGSFVDLVVDSYWRGDPGTNYFRLPTLDYRIPPVSETPIVFFLTRYGCCRELRETTATMLSRTTFEDMNYFRSVETPDGFWLYSDNHSWFPVNENNADIVNFASNLVYAVDSHNTNAFYRIIRDGCNDYPLQSRIYSDSYGMLTYMADYFDTNFIQNVVWKDRKLPKSTMGKIWFHVNHMYRIELPIKPETIIMVR